MSLSPFKYDATKEPQTFLTQADTILKLRGQQYGDHYELFERMAIRFSYAVGEKITPYQAARIMIELKLARLDLNPYDEDSILDIINYTALAGSMKAMEDTKGKVKPTPPERKTLKDIDFSQILNNKPSAE